MAIDTLAKPLLALEIFQGLKPLQITEIARRAERIVYKPGDVLIREDVVGDAAVLIISGRAVRTHGPLGGDEPEMVSAGSLVGEMAMLTEVLHSSTVVAETDVRALRIARADLREQMAADPLLAGHFVHKLVARLQALAHELRDVDQALGVPSARGRTQAGDESLRLH